MLHPDKTFPEQAVIIEVLEPGWMPRGRVTLRAVGPRRYSEPEAPFESACPNGLVTYTAVTMEGTLPVFEIWIPNSGDDE
jgi:hypothetical protein